jgi:hypothetical protein
LLTPAFHGLTSPRQNPARPGRPSGTRTSAGGRREGRQAEASAAAARHTGCRRPLPRRRAGAASEEGSRRDAASRAAASGTEMRVGEGGRQRGRARRWRDTALRACRRGAARRGGEERRDASEKRGALGTGATRKGGSDDDGGREAIWGKRLSVDLEGDGAYIKPPTFCHGSYYQP